MMLGWITFAALMCCAMVAVFLTRRRADHRPFAAFLGVVTLANLVRAGRTLVIPIHPVGSEPYTGAARLAFHIDEALFLTWPAGLAAVVLWLFAAPPWSALPGVAWASAIAYLATHYPAIRGENLRDVYLAAEMGTLCIAAGSITLWTWRRLPPSPAHVCALFTVLIDGVALLQGSLRWGLWSHWYLDQIASIMLYLLLTFYQGYLWVSLQRSR